MRVYNGSYEMLICLYILAYNVNENEKKKLIEIGGIIFKIAFYSCFFLYNMYVCIFICYTRLTCTSIIFIIKKCFPLFVENALRCPLHV